VTADRPEPESFYTGLFLNTPSWSTPYPNVEEAQRVAKIVPLLSEVARRRGPPADLRILDLGCGRGWLTYLADVYGQCLGIDPIGPVVVAARERFPRQRFEVGTAADLLAKGQAGLYDVVLASEVIEHVPVPERRRFVSDIHDLLVPGGWAIVTTDRGELYRRWSRRRGTVEQPEENWLTEEDLRDLFESEGFTVAVRDRAYHDLPELSVLHRVVASRRVDRVLRTLRQRWVLDGLRYAGANCQVWLFTSTE
jgi:SAM-dependent methyltransferase